MGPLYFAEYLREFRSRGKVAVESAVIVRHGDGEDSGSQTFSTAHGLEPSRPSMAETDPDLRVFGLVFPLVKRPGNAFDYISVGRTTNVDVTLPLNQISKFHAYFSRPAPGAYTLADGGSKNGTRIGTRPLEVRMPAPVQSGDKIYFGPYLFSFFSNAEFLGLIASKARPSL
jgi:FHA domain